MSTQQRRPFAVVTGASSGIGFELAKVLAEEGFDLLITAEDAEIDTAQRELNQLTASVECTRLDLSREEEVARLYERIQATARPVDVLVLNAGTGAGGDFVRENDLRKVLRLIDLNVRSTVHLCKLVAQDMVARDEGRILFTSSIASTMPGSFQAAYNASKSFVQSFALALRNELKDTGVTVTSLMPGPTETEFFERAEMEDTPIGESEKDDPAEVARQGFDALMAGKGKVVGGSLKNKAQAAAAKVLPDSVKAEMHRKQAEPATANERSE
ncbi:MAG TPA: SDR family NAD(P)-dependent oxidoreductase [Solirubrobacterales bacterium]|jgi:short-subunit dehydrogenase|nr:SDR family NAD(P)-dependent oxidoreductase [Solirubrobacterales bacterium]